MNTWHWKSILSTASVAWESADWKTRLGLPTLIFDPGQMEGNWKKWMVKYIHLSWLLAVFLLWRGMAWTCEGICMSVLIRTYQNLPLTSVWTLLLLSVFMKICLNGDQNLNLWLSWHLMLYITMLLEQVPVISPLTKLKKLLKDT